MTASLAAEPANAEAEQGVTVELSSLVSGCGIYELGERAKIQLAGADRARWLNGMVTNNVRDLAAGDGVYAFLLNPQGHILGDLYAYNRGETLLVDTERAQLEKILATFDHYIIMDDVEVTDVSGEWTAIGVTGAEAGNVLRKAGFPAAELTLLQMKDVEFQGSKAVLVRGDHPAVPSYELWVEPGKAPATREALRSAGAMPVSASAVELLRIAAGIPRYGKDIRERDLPQETGQERALSFTKGCYIGQEIVERIRSRGAVHRQFAGFRIDGPLPPPGAKLQLDGKDVGEITSSASLPLPEGELKAGLGYVRREAAEAGKVLQSGESQATAGALPFREVFR